MEKFQFFNTDTHETKNDLSALFPGWQGEKEHLCVYSPHDDDAILGAGYAMRAAIESGARVTVIIVCSGSAGYSHPEEKDTIIATRHAEAVACYEAFGIAKEDILFLNFPDFSAISYVGWNLNGGVEGHFRTTITELRTRKVTRVLAPNHYREHLDHVAASMMASYDAPQAGDAFAVDWATPFPVVSVAQYAVWADLDPEDALLKGRDGTVRANTVLIADQEVEKRVIDGIMCFPSQVQIIESLTGVREERRLSDGRYVEVYLRFDPRPSLRYAPYKALVEQYAK